MIYIEDQFALNEQLDCIIPFTCTNYDGKLILEVYEPLKDITEEFINLYSSDPFSDDAINYIDFKLIPFLNEWGYERNSDNLFNWGYAYLIDNISMIKYNKIRSDTRCIIKGNNFLNLTAININLYFDEWDKYGEPVNYATVSDEKLISIAAENPHYLTDSESEIGVETAEGYRGNGYAVSNVAALAKHLASKGKRVWYKCSRHNLASQRTAETAGFRCAGKNYYYVAYKKEE
ncbi:MAG: GNAT family N-acetyltransferase [Eubacteriales bacterium]